MARRDRVKPKQPRLAAKNAPQKLEKRPRRAPELGHNVEKVAWRTGWMDHGGQWDWSNIEKEKFVEILQKLGHWEQKTWAQIMAEDPTNQHDVEVPAMIKDAQDRLVEKNLDDYDSLFRFRFSGPRPQVGTSILLPPSSNDC
jgi:hypothetical protein